MRPTGHGTAERASRGARWLLLGALALLIAAVLPGCNGGSASATPRNVLPEAGQPIMYEFYTDT